MRDVGGGGSDLNCNILKVFPPSSNHRRACFFFCFWRCIFFYLLLCFPAKIPLSCSILSRLCTLAAQSRSHLLFIVFQSKPDVQHIKRGWTLQHQRSEPFFKLSQSQRLMPGWRGTFCFLLSRIWQQMQPTHRCTKHYP